MIKQIKAKKGTIKPIKPFKTLEEEAEFWASHSVIDGIDEGTKIGYHKANKTDTLTIRFQPEQLQVLREEALYQGIGPTTLDRMLILDIIKDRLTIQKE